MKKRKSARFTRGLLSFPLAIGAMSLSSHALAQMAVEEVNGEASLDYAYSRLSGRGVTLERQTGSIGARWNVPIWQFVGGSIGALGGRERADVDLAIPGIPEASFSCDANLWSAVGALFLRDPTIGRVRASYDYGEQPTGCGYSSTFGEDIRRAKSYTYGLDAEYYFENWTIAAGAFRNTQKDTFPAIPFFSIEEMEFRTSLDRYSFGLIYYPTKDWRLGASVGRVEGEFDFHETTYAFSAEYQPPVFGSRATVALVYGRGFDTDTVGLRLTWFFGPQADLQRRDRYFR